MQTFLCKRLLANTDGLRECERFVFSSNFARRYFLTLGLRQTGQAALSVYPAIRAGYLGCTTKSWSRLGTREAIIQSVASRKSEEE